MESSAAGSQPNKLAEASIAILPVAYLPPLNQMALMLKHNEVIWDTHEYFHKQFYYNRCMIYGPNGAQKLTIPIHKRFEKTPLKDILIAQEIPWQKIHWRSFEAAYRRSPYFEYYEEEFYPLYWEHEPTHLLDWNIRLFEVVCKLLQADIKLSFTTSYEPAYDTVADYRPLASPQEPIEEQENKYQQVFEERHGFIPNLSIIDLLFCEGPHAKDYLLS
jgi:hypothetical protein